MVDIQLYKTNNFIWIYGTMVLPSTVMITRQFLLFLATVCCLQHQAIVSCKSLTANYKDSQEKDHQSASSDYVDTSGDDGKNYIPFQWQVEIIKREYDDYVLPDGTVYRVPHGAVPPHRHKGGPYNVPYYVFKDKGHSDKIYGDPKLVETYDTQTLELLQQDWYREHVWGRRRPSNDNNGYHVDNDNNEGYASSVNHETKFGDTSHPEEGRRVGGKQRKPGPGHQNMPQKYYLKSFNGSQRWSNRDSIPGKMMIFSQISRNGTIGGGDSHNKHDIIDGIFAQQFIADGSTTMKHQPSIVFLPKTFRRSHSRYGSNFQPDSLVESTDRSTPEKTVSNPLLQLSYKYDAEKRSRNRFT